MPDVFGFATPEETRARIQARFNEANTNFAKSAGGGPGAQLGLALSQIFAPTVAKHLDTRDDRKVVQNQLMETGLDEKTAKRRAKEMVKPMLDEERKALQIEGLQSEARTVMENVQRVHGPQVAQAMGMYAIANRMANMEGMENEAAQLRQNAGLLMQQEEIRKLELSKLKISEQTDIKNLEIKGLEADYYGKTDFQKRQYARDMLQARLDSGELNPEQTKAIQRTMGELDAKILKDISITGRTESDLSLMSDKTWLRQQFQDQIDDEILIASLDGAVAGWEQTEGWEKTSVAKMGVSGLNFMSKWFNMEIGDNEQEFIQRVVAAHGRSAFTAAKVRHALTGAQMSEFEIKYLEPFLPSPTDSKEQQLAKIAVVRDYTRLRADKRLELVQGGLVDAFFGDRGITAFRSASTGSWTAQVDLDKAPSYVPSYVTATQKVHPDAEPELVEQPMVSPENAQKAVDMSSQDLIKMYGTPAGNQ